MNLESIERFIRKTKRSFTPVTERFGRQGDRGGFLFVGKLDPDERVPPPVCHTFVAQPDAIRFDQFRFFSVEKAIRLQHHSIRSGHVLSSQSRNDEKKHFAGGVLLDDDLFTFSGLPQETDESFVTSNLVCADLMTMDKALEYMGISGNTTHFNEVFRVVRLASSDV